MTTALAKLSTSSLPSTDLRPASDAALTKPLAKLFAAFFTADAGDMVDLRMAVYFEGLRGVPLFAVEAAVREYLSGQVAGHDGRFLPTCAEVARRARVHEQWERDSINRRARLAEFSRKGFIEDKAAAERKDPGFANLADALRKSLPFVGVPASTDTAKAEGEAA